MAGPPTRKDGEDIPVEIKGLMLDPSSNLPIVVLRDPESDRFLPIWIGVFEAQAIALRIEGVDTPRPMTHDLLRSALLSVGARVERIVITDLREKTFFAEVHLVHNGGEVVVDSRPSDALALALRSEAPVFVRSQVLDKAQAPRVSDAPEDQEELRRWLEELGPEDLGEYEM